MTTALTRGSAPQLPQRIEASAMTFGDMLAMGEALVKTGFLPDAIKTGAQAAAIILTGRELGMEPMRALRSLNLVKGKVTENADSQLARFKTDGGRATFLELSDKAAILKVRHPNGDEHTETYTIADATRAGLVNGGGMYNKHPRAMLRSRAITAALKSVGWEGGTGTYDPDELPAPITATDTPSAVDHGANEVAYAMHQSDNMDVAEVAVQEDPMTDKQRAFLAKLMSSSVFTDAERAMMDKVHTKSRARAALDWAKTEHDTRKAVVATAVPASYDDTLDADGADRFDHDDE